MNEKDQLARLRVYGCRCETPLLGWRPGIGPRCRLCNTVAPEDRYKDLCPYCGDLCECDLCDVGPGFVQCGPYHCTACGASQIGAYDDPRELTPDEVRTGWYAPGATPGSSANVINGQIVTHKQMEATYKREFTGNPKYEDKEYVEEWWRRIRG